MILGREPIRLLQQLWLVFVCFAPVAALGQGKPPVPDSSWKSQTAVIGTDAAEARQPSARERQPLENPPDEEADNVSKNDGEESTLRGWPDNSSWRGDGWNDFDEDGMPNVSSSHDEPTPTQSQPQVPNYSLWLGGGLGWTLPFGNLWGSCAGVDAYNRCLVVDGVPSHDYVAQGPAAELDLGARLARNYNLYGLWEHTWLGAGSATSAARSQPERGDTDFLALGLRVSTDPEELGLVLDIAVGTRRMRAVWSDGTELQLTDAPFETRLGIGADVRMGNHWSLMPMIALGLGSFGKVQWVYPNHTVQSTVRPEDVALTHGWVGLQMAAHADIFGTR